MAKSTVAVRFTGDTSDLKKALRSVDDSLDGTASAGKRVATAMERMADDIERELKGTTRAADALADALGPEFASTVSRGDLEKTVNELRQAGLTIEDIEADAEALAAAIKKVDSVGRSAGTTTAAAFDDVDDSVRRTGAEVDKTRGVVANFAGNAAQDIPGVAGSFGALNVAVGQFAEYASEGDINLRRMAAAAGPLLAVSVVVAKIAGDMQKAAEVKAFNAKQAQEWSDAMRDGASATDAIRQSIEDAGQLDIKTSGAFAIDTEDLEKALRDAGLGVDDFLQATELGEQGIRDYLGALKDQGVEEGTLATIGLGLTHVIKQKASATDQAARKTAVYGKSEKDAAEDTEALTERLDEQTAAFDELLEATLAQFDANLGYRRSVDDVEGAVASLNEVQNQHGRDSEEYRDALLDAEGAMLGQADAAVQLADDQAKANGQTLTGEERARLYKDELAKLAGTLAPDSPLRKQLEQYILTLAAVPEQAATKILADTSGAFQSVREFLAFLRAQGISGPAVTGHTGLLDFKQDQLLASSVPRAAHGAIVKATPGGSLLVAGEAGRDEAVIPLDRGLASLGAAPATTVIQLVVSGRVLAEVIAEYEQSQARNRGET